MSTARPPWVAASSARGERRALGRLVVVASATAGRSRCATPVMRSCEGVIAGAGELRLLHVEILPRATARVGGALAVGAGTGGVPDITRGLRANRRLLPGAARAVLAAMRPLVNVLGFALFWLVLIGATLGAGLLLFVPYYLLVFRNRDARAAKAQEKLRAGVMDGETVVHSALQLRVAALTARRLTIAITSSRIIVVTRSLLGGFTMKDYQWKDLTDAQLAENVLPQWFGARLLFAAAGGGSLVVDGVASDAASAIYRYAQQQEQAWEEKRRVRQLEEMRAASGGVTLNAGAAGGVANDVRIGASLDELERMKRLLDSGAISDAEYQEIKAKVLGRVAG